MATDLKALNDYLAKCFLNRAKFLADRGIPVVWAAPRTKRSTLEDWPNRATTQIEVLAEWNRQSPSRNTAAVSKDEFSCAFDIDHPSIMPQLEKETGQKVPRTLIVRSSKPAPLGHYYFLQTERSRALGNRQYNIDGERAFDFQQNDKYVVGPGSIHPTGAVYSVIDDSPLVPIPDWLCDFIDRLSSQQPQAQAVKSEPSKTPAVSEVAARMLLRDLAQDSEDNNRKLAQSMGFAHRHQADEKFAIWLVKYSGLGDAERLEKFSKHKLHSDRTAQYDRGTFKKAVEWIALHASSSKAEKLVELDGSFGIDIKRRHQKYFWEPWLPVGQFVTMGGRQGEGKSPVVIDLAARMTKGANWPDGSPNTYGPRSVILLSMEDDPAAKTMPMFDLAGGDSNLIWIASGTKVRRNATDTERNIALDKDIPLLIKKAKEMPDLGMIVIDPITNYLGAAKMNAEEEVRPILMQLNVLAQELGVIVPCVSHFNGREKGTDPLRRVMGAAAFTGAARGVILFGPDPDAESTHSHIITLGRGDTEAGGLRYQTEVENVEWDGDTSKVVKIVWGGKTEVHADDATDSLSRSDKSRIAEASILIAEFLKAGKRPAAECLNFLKMNGYESLSPTRIRRKAKVGSRQEGVRNHVWYLETGGEAGLSF